MHACEIGYSSKNLDITDICFYTSISQILEVTTGPMSWLWDAARIYNKVSSLTCSISTMLGTRRSEPGRHSHLPPTAPPSDLRRPQRVLKHEKLGNYVTWPAWENWNVFQFNWCLYSSEISDWKSPWPHKCTTIFYFYNPHLPDAIICQSWICQR